jgi:hypothetical protein
MAPAVGVCYLICSGIHMETAQNTLYKIGCKSVNIAKMVWTIVRSTKFEHLTVGVLNES